MIRSATLALALLVFNSEAQAQTAPQAPARPTPPAESGRAALEALGEDRVDADDLRVRLGVEHILTGFDHLLFVMALVLLVSAIPRLFWTITAFTAAHSLTLAAATLGWVHVPSPPVEATIALSIVPILVRALRTSILEAMGSDYVRTARAKGLRERAVVSAHVLRNAPLPALTLPGLAVG